MQTLQTANVWQCQNLRMLGRFLPEAAQSEGLLPLFWAGSGLECLFTGSELHLILEADFEQYEPWIAVFLNGAPLLRMPLARGKTEVCLFRGMAAGAPKRVRLLRETQPVADDARQFAAVRALVWADGAFLPLPAPACRLEFIGDSLTSGEGLVGTRAETDWVTALFAASQSWAVRTADALGAEFRLISQSGWGVRSGWDNDPRCTLPSIWGTLCAPARSERCRGLGAAQALSSGPGGAAWQPDAVLINLGTNDAGAMGNPPWAGPEGQSFCQRPTAEGMALLQQAAEGFLHTLRAAYPAAALVWACGMLGDAVRSPLEGAVKALRAAGDARVYYLPLPEVTNATMGSRQHPGPGCHAAAAGAAAGLLRQVLGLK